MRPQKQIKKERAKRIREFRESKGLNQTEFAQRMGYSQKLQSKIELEQVGISVKYAEKVEEIYELPAQHLLYGSEEDQDKKPTVREGESTYKPLFDDVRAILESGNAELVNAFRGNIKAFLGAIKAVKEKRQYHRFSLNIPVEVKLLDEPGAPIGAVINASQMGLLVQSSYEIPKGKEISLELSFPKESGIQSFTAKGRVMWREKRRINEAEEFQYGLKFVEVLNDGHAKLESILERGEMR